METTTGSIPLDPGPFEFQAASIPLLISMPHNGNLVPGDLSQQMTATGKHSIDTDWFLDRLYNFPSLQGAGRIVANYSRYAIDLNRAATDESLYPGQTTTGLFPTGSFAGLPLFTAPRTAEEKARWLKEIWVPYHKQIQTELDRLKQQFPKVVLFDAHSIASQVPRLFDGQLPDLNFGTNQGRSCCWTLEQSLTQFARTLSPANRPTDRELGTNSGATYSHVFNGRFVGGFITRHFGRPDSGIHAIQLELSQATYLDENTGQWCETKANHIRPVLDPLLQTILRWLHS